MAYYSTKTYGHNIGLSACFRQPNAHSHCKFLHGYALQFKFVFGCDELDDKNWVVDFGGLKPLKQWLEDKFDHKVVLDLEDPMMQYFDNLQAAGLCEITALNGVGVERFAYHAWRFADQLVRRMTDDRCYCLSAECAEHGANSAIYKQEN
ncbi:MAG: hypothetical protein CBB72_016325 [Muricauda sp. TMED12]|nr:MAG: hypothetical protein CBB72_016325 [Muricauda sp. TMED12]